MSQTSSESSDSERQDPEVRLELTNAGVRQVWALYSQERDAAATPSSVVDDDVLSIFLRDLPGIAWRGRWYLAACLALTVCLGVLYLLHTPPVYNVAAEVLVERRASPFDGDGRVRGNGNFLATQAEIIHSPSIVRQALVGVPALAEPPADRDPALPYDPVGKVLNTLVVTPIVGTDVLSVSYRTARPELGVELVDGLLTAYRGYVVDLEQSPQTDALALLSRKESELRAQLHALEQQYQALRGESESMGQGEDALRVQKSVLERQAQMLVEAKSRRIDLENRLNAMQWSRSQGGTGVSGNNPIQEELWRAELHYAELTQQYSDKHPEVRAVKHQIETLRRQLEASSTRALEAEVRAARSTEQRLASLYEEELVRAKSLDAHHLEEEELRGEIDRTAELHQAALSKLKDLELTVEAQREGGAGLLIRVLEGPLAGDSPLWPRPELVLLPCALVGLMGGLGLAMVAERWRAHPAQSILPARRDPMGKQGFEPVG